ncbi:MAG: transcriptional regulator [Lachnospiraceae bacterium]|nr:transcriptional regulator [Lachnospiraceae bacterium]
MSSTDEVLLIAVSRLKNELFRRVSPILTKAELSTTQFEVLEVLLFDDQIPVGTIQKKVLGTAGNIPLVIKNLEKYGYVTREKDSRDKRVSLISLTDQGRRLIEETYPKVKARLTEILSFADEKEKKELITSLYQLLKGIEGLS